MSVSMIPAAVAANHGGSSITEPDTVPQTVPEMLCVPSGGDQAAGGGVDVPARRTGSHSSSSGGLRR